MARVSRYFGLGLAQPSLEFVDVDVLGDTPLFVDPHALREISSPWGSWCVTLLQSFFNEVISCINGGDHDRARTLLSRLNEPNETHLGLSEGAAQGRGRGDQLAREVWQALSGSRAATSGLLSDLEDSILFVEGIGHDIISDITTNIVREPLIHFTQDACTYYGIPMTSGLASGRVWNHTTTNWDVGYTTLPLVGGSPLILVPKSVVRRVGAYDPGQYLRHYILPALQEQELAAGSGLVETLKNGRKRVTKKSVLSKHGGGKPTNVKVTINDPSILRQYKTDRAASDRALDHTDISDLTKTPEPDWDALLQAVLDVPSGKPDADTYHKAIDALLGPLFYPDLDFPKREHKLHQGRKRIDINYTNVARGGFFHWLHAVQGVACSQIPLECKNYGKAVKNPEFDQLAGRFGVNRGQFGILCYRGYADKDDVVQRCRDAAADGRGFIVALDDEDLATLVNARKAGGASPFAYLIKRFQEIV